MKRVRHGPEFMDDPDAPREELASALRFLRLVNRRIGGRAALLGHLRRWSRRWPRGGEPVTMLDIATGSADLPIAAVRWARSRGFDLRVTAVDIHPTTLALAREHLGRHPAEAEFITIEQADALELAEKHRPHSFDYIHAGLFLHHLGELEALTVLRIMDRLARAGIVWNDLARSRTALAATRLITLPCPRMVRHDAAVSVMAGFTRAEALAMAERLELSYVRYRESPLTGRFTLAGERPGAWES